MPNQEQSLPDDSSFFRQTEVNLPRFERFFASRLIRSATLASDKTLLPWQITLARASTLSSYRDMTSIGLENRAKEIIRQYLRT